MTFKDYPFSPPNVKFLTKMFHPNIAENGDVQINILNSFWSPVYDISNIIFEIYKILKEPELN